RAGRVPADQPATPGKDRVPQRGRGAARPCGLAVGLRLTGGNALAHQLIREGVGQVFAVRSVQLDYAVDALARLSDQIAYGNTRHELTPRGPPSRQDRCETTGFGEDAVRATIGALARWKAVDHARIVSKELALGCRAQAGSEIVERMHPACVGAVS